jgi:TonB family protein
MDSKQGWFERWPKPGGSADCPAETKLVEWASRPGDPEAKSHLSHCINCTEIVEFLGRSANRSSDGLHLFMSEVRKRAQEQAGQRMSLWKSCSNYVLASPARAIGAVAGLAALFLIVTSGLWRHLGIFQTPSQSQTIQMDADSNQQVYASAMEKMRRSYTILSSGAVSGDEVSEQIDEFNSSLIKVDLNRLQPEQRLQLENLAAQFHAEVGLKGTGMQLTKLNQVKASEFDMPKDAKGAKGTLASTDWRETYTGPTAQRNQETRITPLEITFKPNPAYTEEARTLKVEGEVLLEVEFGADETLHVNRVIRGLGHGLDETAIAAANRMQFKPAMRGGQPVDSTAVVHVIYQLN